MNTYWGIMIDFSAYSTKPTNKPVYNFIKIKPSWVANLA